ncbi:MAG: hypothetical protein Q4G48_03725 [Bacteroidia bacterium]|nr:hypothetical protein [Bacteroidia bacterium]
MEESTTIWQTIETVLQQYKRLNLHEMKDYDRFYLYSPKTLREEIKNVTQNGNKNIALMF